MRSNIINAIFGDMTYIVTDPVFQYDYGLSLNVSNIPDLPQVFEAHFSNSKQYGETTTQIVENGLVHIPDVYLTTGDDVFCFIFLHNTADDGETNYIVRIPVEKRSKPTDVAPTPEEQSIIEQTLAVLNFAVANAELDAQNAENSARSAAESAAAAAEVVSDIGSYAERAEVSASSAASSASGAFDSASNASSSALAANSSRRTAEQKAEDARTYALLSEAYAQGTNNGSLVPSGRPGYHDNSYWYSQQANGYSNTASQKATSATNSERNALSYRDAALAASGEAAGYAESAAASALIASQKSALIGDISTLSAYGSTVAEILTYIINEL